MAFILTVGWIALIAFQNANNSIDSDIENKYHLNETTKDITGADAPKPDDMGNNRILWIGSVILLALSLFNGSVGSDKNDVICLNCGQIRNTNVAKRVVAALIFIMIGTSAFSQHHNKGRYIGGHGSSHKSGHYRSNNGRGDRYSSRKHKR